MTARIVDFINTDMRKTLLTLALSLCLLGAGAQTRVRTYSPKLSASTLRLTEKRGTQDGVAADAVANLFIRLRENADKERLSRVYGVRFNVGCGDVYTAVVPVSSIVALADDNDVEEIDAGQEVRTMMDNVRTLTNVDAVHSATGIDTAYKGNGVLVGIIDAGFDFRHPNFRDSNGKSRIRAVWDQNNFMQTNSSYGYGKEYLTGEELASVSRDMELTGDTHGTHVAGIATGSYDGPYLGVAPEADIVLVSTNKTEQGIIDGLDWLLKYAEKVQKPISINLSIGTVLGFKDGTDAFTVLTDNLMKGQKGKILSIAAGNEGLSHSNFPGGSSDCISVTAIGPDGLPAYYTCYGPGCNIAAPGGETAGHSGGEKAGILSTLVSEVSDADYGYMQGTSMACPHVSGIAALGLSYALQKNKKFTRDEFISMLLTSVNDIEARLEGSKTSGTTLQLEEYRGKMGSGLADAYQLLMQIEGTPCLKIPVNEMQAIVLTQYFGGSAENLTYREVSVSDDDIEKLGMPAKPEMSDGKLLIRCNRPGVAHITVKAIAGGKRPGSDTVMGGIEVTKEFAVIARETGGTGGGWL